MGKKRIKRGGNLNQRERHLDLSTEQILKLMAEEDRPLLFREILRHMDLRKETRPKAKGLLKDLAEEGKIVRIRGSRYGLPSKMNLVVGRVKCHPDGYGFVIPEREGDEDIFISPRNLQESMNGDRVVARVESVQS